MAPMQDQSNLILSTGAAPVLNGYCHSCATIHYLQSNKAEQYGTALMKRLEQEQRLDFFSKHPPKSGYSTAHLFGPAGGKMFGVLEGVDQNGSIRLLYAFSGQFNGFWNIPGWAPPLFNEERWRQTNDSTEKQIKRLGAMLKRKGQHSHAAQALKETRKNLSRQLMAKLHSLYQVQNFRGQTSTLAPFFSQQKGIPTGTGDCCAPKLLSYAIKENITPLGIAEFYWGESNTSKTRRHGLFYPACDDKCAPLMGFILCGLEEQQRKWETAL